MTVPPAASPICEPGNQALYAHGHKHADGHDAQAVHVNPGTVVVEARPTKRQRQGHRRQPEQLLRPQRQPGAQRQRHHQPAAGYRPKAAARAPNVTFGFTSHGQACSSAVTKEIAQRGQEAQLPGVTKPKRRAALRDRAGRTSSSPCPRSTTPQYPERDRRHQRLGDHRRLHARLRAEPRQRAAVRRAADPPGADLPLAGLGDARQDRRSTRASIAGLVGFLGRCACSCSSSTACWG